MATKKTSTKTTTTRVPKKTSTKTTTTRVPKKTSTKTTTTRVPKTLTKTTMTRLTAKETGSVIKSNAQIKKNMFYNNLVNLELEIKIPTQKQIASSTEKELQTLLSKDVANEMKRLITEAKISKKDIDAALKETKEKFIAQLSKKKVSLETKFTNEKKKLEKKLETREKDLTLLKTSIEQAKAKIDEYMTNVANKQGNTLQIEDKNASAGTKVAAITKKEIVATTKAFKAEIKVYSDKLKETIKEKEQIIKDLNQNDIDKTQMINDANIQFEKNLLPLEVNGIEAMSWLRSHISLVKRLARDIRLEMSMRNVASKKDELDSSIKDIFEVAEVIKSDYQMFDDLDSLVQDADHATKSKYKKVA